jgi:hypothetical protein
LRFWAARLHPSKFRPSALVLVQRDDAIGIVAKARQRISNSMFRGTEWVAGT